MKQVELMPTAKISVKKSVLKQYRVKNDNAYFLKKGAEFEIELYNPLQEVLMCKVYFNGKENFNSGLVIYPGQRIFLERHIDTDKKLKFDTYLVDDDPLTAYATSNNGLVEVRFYKEEERQPIPYLNNISYTSYTNDWTLPTITIGDYVTTTYTNDITNAFYASSTGGVISSKSLGDVAKIETGRVEKGNKSNQAFINTDREFEINSFHIEKFKILPESIKLKTEDDFKRKKYCSECGAKAGQTDKFCAQCGEKL